MSQFNIINNLFYKGLINKNLIILKLLHMFIEVKRL